MPDVCDRCGYPVIQLADGQWTHSSAADGVFCSLVMVPASKVRDE
jgi:hypothetical protein